jgi:DUF305 family protein family protein
MRMPGHNNHRQLSVAGWGPRQPERGVQKRNDHECAMKKTFMSGVLALLVLTYPAHASAQQATAADKVGQSHQRTAEASFMAENKVAMNKMMMDMAVKPFGNVDADFTAMMIPHHQGAVDMAEAELRYGHNRQLRRIARNIIAGQRQQIGAMKAALGQPLSDATSSTASPGQSSQIGSRSAHNAAR